MNFLQRAAASIVMTAAAAVVAAPAFAQTCACAPGGGYVIQADEAPPPLPEYDQPPIPAPGYYWTPGYWAWNNYDYYWVPGAWVEPPQPGLLWTPGYWALAAGVYAFRPGYWGSQVGFYGGIDYGFGYAGSGYQGGRWDNGRFFYNTAVNNVGAAHIANVYHQPIVRSATVNRASFNGGPGGVIAKPTNEELLAEKEPHVRATALQANQARAASMRSEQFVSTNRGKPAIAATQRPGQFKGKGVIPARAAGKTAEAAPEKPAAVGKPVKPEVAPNAPKVEEKRPAVEKLAKPEAAPNAPKREEKPITGRPPAAAERPPAAAERTPERPPIAGRPPAAERPVRPEPPHPAAQRAMERPPAAERRPAQPERRPPPNECGRPGLPPCPK
jgi:WXXGXW repeat (2 copies)